MEFECPYTRTQHTDTAHPTILTGAVSAVPHTHGAQPCTVDSRYEGKTGHVRETVLTTLPTITCNISFHPFSLYFSRAHLCLRNRDLGGAGSLQPARHNIKVCCIAANQLGQLFHGQVFTVTFVVWIRHSPKDTFKLQFFRYNHVYVQRDWIAALAPSLLRP